MAGDTNRDTPDGKERRRAFADSSTAAASVAYDADGNVYSAANPALFERTDTKLPVKVPAISAIYGEDLHAVNGAFAGTPLKMYNADALLWTIAALIGPGNFTAVSAEQNHTPAGANAAKWTTPNVGDTIEVNSGGSVDLNNYVSLTFWIYISTGYSPGDTIVVYWWDGANVVGLEVDIAPKINILQPGSWQLVDLPLTAMQAETATVESLRLRFTAKVGQAPTVYLDDFQLEETSGEEPFFIAAPAGFEFTINHISGVILGTNAIAPSIDPNTLLDGPALTNGLLISVWIGGMPTPIQTVFRVFCDFADNDFKTDGIPYHGGGSTCVKLLLVFDSPLKFSTPADWVPGDPLLDFFLVEVRDNLTIYDRFRFAGFGGLKLLPAP
jgi:hypothetical protein